MNSYLYASLVAWDLYLRQGVLHWISKNTLARRLFIQLPVLNLQWSLLSSGLFAKKVAWHENRMQVDFKDPQSIIPVPIVCSRTLLRTRVGSKKSKRWKKLWDPDFPNFYLVEWRLFCDAVLHNIITASRMIGSFESLGLREKRALVK